MNDIAAVRGGGASCQLPARGTNVLLPHDHGCRRDRGVRIGDGTGHTKPTTATSTRWYQRLGHITVTHTKTGPGTFVGATVSSTPGGTASAMFPDIAKSLA
jgi:hypothetical protein